MASFLWRTSLLRPVKFVQAPCKTILITARQQLISRRMKSLRRNILQGVTIVARSSNDSSPKVLRVTEKKRFNLLELTMIIMRIIVISWIFSLVLMFYIITRVAYAKLFPHVLLKAMEFLGPTFIKFGQWMSTRRDTFPAELCETLARLQHDTPAHSWFYTRYILKATYGPNWQKLFVFFDGEKPIGSGCCAQVYKAWINRNVHLPRILEPHVPGFIKALEYMNFGHLLAKIEEMTVEKNSTGLCPVAVKILHPGIESQLKVDLNVLRIMAGCLNFLVPSLRWLSLTDCVEEFSVVMKNQVNMELEALNLTKFAQNFSSRKNVIFPQPYDEFTRPGVLVESFHEGSPISEYLHHEDEDLQRKLAKIGVSTVFKMIFMDNFVHCDLHPGNILVQESRWDFRSLGPLSKVFESWLTTEPRLVILDCGIVATLDERCRQNLHDVFRSVAKGQGEEAGNYILKHSRHMTPDPVGFRKTMGNIINHHLRGQLTLSNVNVSTVVSELFSAMIKYQVKQDGAFSSIILSMAVMEGLGRSLDPKIDIIAEALPFVAGAL